MSASRQYSMLRLNVINRDKPENKISIIVNARTPVSKLKRKIQQQYAEIYAASILISVIQDSKGFVISNNSTIGEHVGSNQTILIDIHKEKTGNNMNLTSDITDIFLTLRYVTGSVVDKIEKIQISQENVIDVIPQVLHLGFWFTNLEVVHKACRFLNKVLDSKRAEYFVLHSQEIHNVLLIKLLNFWFVDIQNSCTVYPDICWELLQLIQKLTCNQKYSQFLKGNPVIKHVAMLSKNYQTSSQIKKMALRIIKNINGGKGSLIQKTKSSYIPSILSNQYMEHDVEQVLQMLSSTNQNKLSALDILSDQKNNVMTQATVRFDFYSKLMNIFTIKSFKNKTQLMKFNKTVQLLLDNTTKQKSADIMQKDILKKIHKFLLESPKQTHEIVMKFCQKVCSQSVSSSMFNIQQAAQLLFSPYLDFQSLILSSLSGMSEPQRKISKIRFVPGIKDLIRLSLKSQNNQVIKQCLKVLSNLCLDQQCRYQIMNLKGVQLFLKYLESSEDSDIQRFSAKGLLNLSIASRQVKVKVLGGMNTVIQKLYRKQYDGITEGFIQTLMKSPNI